MPVIRLSHLTEHQKRTLAIADNKLPENAGWDEALLAQELKILSEVDFDFDVTITGFVIELVLTLRPRAAVHLDARKATSASRTA